jgi:carbamoyl-phosphate synthase small subunit
VTPLAKLALEDGTVYTGRALGAIGERWGEVVFNTSMAGYQEVLTDPSYRGQIVCMTYPEMGNYGVNCDDAESARPQVDGFIVREISPIASNYRSEQALDDYLKAGGIVGLAGIDTRALVRRLRIRGAMTGVISSTLLDDMELVKKAQSAPSMVGRDLVKEVTPREPATWNTGFDHPLTANVLPARPGRLRVAALDFGMKRNILRCLTQVGCQVAVLPGTTKAADILKLNPDGLFLSNGPGDPGVLGYIVSQIKELLGKKPIFGICLGHQLLGQALGGKTFKLKFGHRGANQPVLNRLTDKVEITVQNHGFAVDPETLPADVEVTHVNLNDQTLEGLRQKRLRLFSVQYHPEASAGPHDSVYLFEEFARMMDENRA